jgi:Kae1-associated kinase Bud32
MKKSRMANKSDHDSVEDILLYQGAEAKVYKMAISNLPEDIISKLPVEGPQHLALVRKERLQKLWRHPVLDAKLRKSRLKQEFNCLQKAFQANLPVPQPFYINKVTHMLYMEYIQGCTLKTALSQWPIETSIFK